MDIILSLLYDRSRSRHWHLRVGIICRLLLLYRKSFEQCGLLNRPWWTNNHTHKHLNHLSNPYILPLAWLVSHNLPTLWNHLWHFSRDFIFALRRHNEILQIKNGTYCNIMSIFFQKFSKKLLWSFSWGFFSEIF